MKRFLIQSSILTIILLALGIFAYSTFLSAYYHLLLPLTLIFFYLTTNLVHAYLLKIAVDSGNRFGSKYMAVNFIKMFFYMAVAILVAFLNREYARVFLLNFLFVYLIYTTFEVVQITKFVRQKKV